MLTLRTSAEVQGAQLGRQRRGQASSKKTPVSDRGEQRRSHTRRAMTCLIASSSRSRRSTGTAQARRERVSSVFEAARRRGRVPASDESSEADSDVGNSAVLESSDEGAEKGQSFEIPKNQDPMEVVMKLGTSKLPAFIFPGAREYRNHYKEVHRVSRVPEVSQNYLKQLVYNYLTSSNREKNYSKMKTSKGHQNEEWESEDEQAMLRSHAIKSDGELIRDYWGANNHKRAMRYNAVVETVTESAGGTSPILADESQSEAPSSAESSDINDFIASDNESLSEEEEEVESESSGERRRNRRGRRKSRRKEEDSDESEEQEEEVETRKERRTAAKTRTRPPRISILADIQQSNQSRTGGRDLTPPASPLESSSRPALPEVPQDRKPARKKVIEDSDEEDGAKLISPRPITSSNKKKRILESDDEPEACGTSKDVARVSDSDGVSSSPVKRSRLRPAKLAEEEEGEQKDHEGTKGEASVSTTRYGLRQRATKEEKVQTKEEWHNMLKERNRSILKDTQVKEQEAVYISDDSLADFVVEDDTALHSDDWRLAIQDERDSTDEEGGGKARAAKGSGDADEAEERSQAFSSKDPLVVALHAGDLEQVRSLLKKQQLTFRSIRTHDLLHAAIEGKSLECVKEVCGRGADVNLRHGKSEVTPLLFALSLRQEAMAGFLLERNADVFRSDSDGTLPLHMASAACGTRLALESSFPCPP
eukprot:764433-Hanusia_phi.AAC.3